MALYALGDLHLSFQADKPMDAFGKVWRHHERKIEKYVNRIVKPEDTLVLTGDHSWGRSLEECREEDPASGESRYVLGCNENPAAE